ncbi:unnamed protein product [Effrenium voratum]|uniref:RAP domain-containing protein n=1 Tax=Effrenium voratum TaxID=2562239 RepID=A0AA36JML7_9DINO|nr:unnamed protein product [Effrenium voratum]
MALRCLAIRIVIRGRLLTRGCSETAWQQQSALARNLRGLEPQEVCQAVARFGGAEALDFLNLLTALQRLVRRSPRRMPSEEEELARQLMRAMCQHLGSSDSRERHRARRLGWLAQGAWAAAKCRELPEAQALLQEVGLALRAVLERRKAPLEARDAAQLLWALASGRVALPGLSLAGRLRPQDFSPQDTANVLWALGRLEDEELFAELLPRAEAQVEQMEPQGLAAVLATLAQRRGDATVATAAAGLVQRAARRVQRDIEQTSRLQDSAWRVAELVQLCWAFSALQLEAAQFQHLALRLAREANSPSSSQAFAARDLSLLAWSFANSSSVPLALEVPRIAQAALPRLREFDNQGVANLCWALGSTGTADRAIFARLAHAEELDFTARQLANICWASATVAFLQRDIFEQADRLAQRSLGAFQAPEAASLLWSFAQVSLQPTWHPEVPGTAREAANVCWSLAVLGLHREDVLAHTAKLMEGDALEIHLAQWHLAFLAYKLEAAGPAAASRFGEAWLRRTGRAAHAVAQRSTSSKIHGDVSAEVRKICRGELIQDELVVEQCLVLDIAWPQRKLALEVDGPWHWARTLPGDVLVELGPSRLKRRLLDRLGWQVLHLSYDAWRCDRRAAMRELLPVLKPKNVLGKGSFGKAYLVKNTEENELCVVKQMETSAMEAKAPSFSRAD